MFSGELFVSCNRCWICDAAIGDVPVYVLSVRVYVCVRVCVYGDAYMGLDLLRGNQKGTCVCVVCVRTCMCVCWYVYGFGSATRQSERYLCICGV